MTVCPKCNGKGKTTEYDGVRKFWCDYKCEVCNGTGEVEMTNEEWLRQCNTEQLAEYVLNVWMDGAFNVNAEFGLNEAKIERHKGYIVEWLKQPHNTWGTK